MAILRSQRADGILLVTASGTSSFAHIENAVRAGVPVVCLDRLPAALKVDSVCADNVRGAKRCVEHLIDMGHREIAVFGGPQGLGNERERHRGYELALNDAGIPLQPELVWRASFAPETASHVCEQKLARIGQRPSAIFTTNCIMAIAFLEAMYRLGLRCPEDTALATFDELTTIRLFEPSITTVVQPAYRIGHEGALLLLERIQAKTPTAKPIAMRLPTVLEIRHSSTGSQLSSLPKTVRQ